MSSSAGVQSAKHQGVRFFGRLIREDAARRGVAPRLALLSNPVQQLREHTLAELRRGNMRYKLFVLRKPVP